MKAYDAIVVGAGPAGSTCAARLKDAGIRVKLFDRQQFPRVKPCAGWITPQVVEALHLDVPDYRRKNVFQPISGFRTGLIGGRMIETHFDEPVSLGVRRIEFDNYLLQRSEVPCEFSSVGKIVRRNSADRRCSRFGISAKRRRNSPGDRIGDPRRRSDCPVCSPFRSKRARSLPTASDPATRKGKSRSNSKLDSPGLVASVAGQLMATHWFAKNVLIKKMVSAPNKEPGR